MTTHPPFPPEPDSVDRGEQPMREIVTCALCGRRGVRDFEATEAAESGDRSWRCANREVCQRRQDDARADQAHQPTDPGGSVPYATRSALAGVARELEALRATADAVPTLFKQVEDLARVVQDLAGQMATRPMAGAALSWLDMPDDPASTLSVLEDLTAWLPEVFLRYRDAAMALPECWMWHPDIVEELLWLMHAWLAAYRAEDATVARAGDWHDRYRPGVVQRIKTLGGSCSLENHQAHRNATNGHHTGGGPVPLVDAMEPLAAWWATCRDQAPPEPTEQHLATAAAAAAQRRGGGRR